MTTPIIILNPAGFVQLRFDPLLLADIKEKTELAVNEARATAPKKSGRGAASIRSEITYDGGEGSVRIGWDVEHYYMKFHERGTKFLDARPFLVPAVDKYLNMGSPPS